jgi:hypothetical protein
VRPADGVEVVAAPSHEPFVVRATLREWREAPVVFGDLHHGREEAPLDGEDHLFARSYCFGHSISA